MKPRYMRHNTSKKSKKNVSFTQSKKEQRKQIEQHCAQQAKISKRLTDQFHLFLKNSQKNSNLKSNWKLDKYLRAHPSVLFFRLNDINKKLDKLLNK